MAASVASLEHLTGPSGGAVSWLGETSLKVALDPRNHIHIVSLKQSVRGSELVARLHWVDNSFELKAAKGHSIWVNGQPTKSKRLNHLDMIEFCEAGPMSRYYLHDKKGLSHRSTSDIISDSVMYFRTSRQRLYKRLLNAVGHVFRRLALETTILFRIGVLIALGSLVFLAYQQYQLGKLLQQQIDAGTAQLESFSSTLARSSREALTPGDLEALRLELGERMTTTAGRILKLEQLSTAAQRIIANSAPSVVFLQGSYGFRETASNRMLRMMLGSDGKPLLFPNGLPMLSPDGNGAIAKRQFVGSGFLVGDDGFILTNRHLGLPWEFDGGAKMLTRQGFVPEITRFVGYRPGASDGEAIELVQASEETDLALLRYIAKTDLPKGLPVADTAPKSGDQVILMGYPTGLRSLLAQAGGAFVSELQKSEDVEFWSVAERLSKAGLIIPLASRGIVGRASDERIVYDAETTHGGSGGPVLNTNGEVVAVNAAILPEYGGSNLGVPVHKVHKFLEQTTLSSASEYLDQ